MLASLATRGALVVEHSPAVAIGALEGRNADKDPAALGTAEGATGELPDTPPGRRALLVVPESITCPVYNLFRNASLWHGNGDPLLARLVGITAEPRVWKLIWGKVVNLILRVRDSAEVRREHQEGKPNRKEGQNGER